MPPPHIRKQHLVLVLLVVSLALLAAGFLAVGVVAVFEGGGHLVLYIISRKKKLRFKTIRRFSDNTDSLQTVDLLAVSRNWICRCVKKDVSFMCEKSHILIYYFLLVKII